MSSRRPVNLDLTTIKFPPAAIISILHRVSGVLVFLLIPLLLWLAAKTLSSPEGFVVVQQILSGTTMKIILWITCSALLFHLVAGIRHIVMDLGYGETLRGGTIGSYLVALIAIILMIWTGVRLW